MEKIKEIRLIENNPKYERIINKHLDRMGIETVIQDNINFLIIFFIF